MRRAATKNSKKKPTAGERIIKGLDQAIAWASGEKVAVRITRVEVPVIDVRKARRRLRLSQSQFASRFGFAVASVRNWEQRRTRPDGPARVLLAVIARHPDAVEDALKSRPSAE